MNSQGISTLNSLRPVDERCAQRSEQHFSCKFTEHINRCTARATFCKPFKRCPLSSSPVPQPSLSTRWRYVNRNRFACSTRNGLNNWPKNSAWPQQSNSKRAEHKSNNNNNVDSKSNNNNDNSVSKHKWINKFMKHNRRFNRSALSLTPQAPPDFDLNSTHFFASPCLSHWRKTIVVAFIFHTLHFFYA